MATGAAKGQHVGAIGSPDAMAAALLAQGAIGGKYRLERIVAVGGMGIVFAARHEALANQVAIKILPPWMIREQSVARFVREARATARIRSQHVARVLDCGVLEDGVPFLAMEYLTGRNLAEELERRGRLGIEESVDIALQTLDGLGEAHALGIIHRDLKPSNVFLANGAHGSTVVKVIDFGISKLVRGLDGAADDLTETSALLGSPRYMSPEQAKTPKEVDARADLWSLGVVLYELLTGIAPFAGDTVAHTLSNVLLYRPAPVRVERPEVPHELERVIERCLEVDRERRYSSAAELARALVPFGSSKAAWLAEGVAAGSGRAAIDEPADPALSSKVAAAAIATTDRTIPTDRSFVRVDPRRPRRTFALVAGATLAVATAAGFVVRARSHAGPAPAANATEPMPFAAATAAAESAVPEAPAAMSAAAPPSSPPPHVPAHAAQNRRPKKASSRVGIFDESD